MRLSVRLILVSVLAFCAAASGVTRLAAQETAVVHAVLFWDRACGNCEVVINDVLPPLQERYDSRLQVHKFELSELQSYDLFLRAVEHYQVPDERHGVPLMVIGDQVLSGQDEIAEGLEREIVLGLSAGGVGFPEVLGTAPDGVTLEQELRVSEQVAVREPDPLANAAAVAMLGLVAVSLAYVLVASIRPTPLPSIRALVENPATEGRSAVPFLALAGLAVSGYLAYGKLSHTGAICPIGDCDAVQHSQYADILGIPVALLGALSYVAVLALWVWGRHGSGLLASVSLLGIFGIGFVGTAFSGYLTYLEPFVIGSVCVWCLVSAAIMALILLSSHGIVMTKATTGHHR